MITKRYIDKNFWRKYIIIEFLSGKKIYGKVNALRSNRGDPKLELIDAHLVRSDGLLEPKSKLWQFSKSWIKIDTIKDVYLYEELI